MSRKEKQKNGRRRQSFGPKGQNLAKAGKAGLLIPEGIERMRYLNEGYALCHKCGAVMDYIRTGKGKDDIYKCPACKWTVDKMDYEPDIENEESDSEIPVGCAACGGPYPNCKVSCPIFDD